MSPEGQRRVSHWFSYVPKNLSIISTSGTSAGLQIREASLFHIREGACALGPDLILENSSLDSRAVAHPGPVEQVACAAFRLCPQPQVAETGDLAQVI